MRILAELDRSEKWRPTVPPHRWLTTLDVARVLAVTTRWVRWLARHGELPCEVTASGQHLFRRDEVRRVLITRTEARARSRPAQLAAVRVRMLKAGYEPRQLSFLSGLGLRIVARRERADPQAEVKAARSREESIGSEKERSVNRKVASR
jgi:hypothetical protein